MKKGFQQFCLFLLLSAFSFSNLPVSAIETIDAKRIVPEQKPGKPATAKEEKKKPEEIPPTDIIPSSLGDIQAVVIPDAFGTINELFRGRKEGAFIFHIRDVHANPEVQQNIAKIADHINRTYFGNSVELVAVEGAKGKVDLGLLKAVPDEEVRRTACQFLIDQGLMTGGEYYGAHVQAKALVFGIEEGALYFDNLQAFRDTVNTSRATQEAVAQFQNALAQLSQKMVSPDLQEFYAKQKDYENRKLPLSQYCLYLKEVAKKKEVNLEVHPQIKNVLASIALEKQIDFKRMEREKLQLMAELQQKGSQEQTAALVTKTMDLRTGRLSAADYYQYLMEAAAEQKINMEAKFGLVAKYAQLVKQQSQIQAPVLFQELAWAEKELKEKLFLKDEEKKLDQIQEELTILVKLRGLGLSRDEWKQFAENESKYDYAGWRQFVQNEATKQGLQVTISPEWDQIGTQLTAAKKFYEDALARDKVLVKNLFDELERKNQKVAIVVTGGFHTAAITQQIKAKDISYAVITPRMTQSHDEKLYMALMMGQETAALSPPSNWPNQLAEAVGVPEAVRDEVAGRIRDAIEKTVAAIGVLDPNVASALPAMPEYGGLKFVVAVPTAGQKTLFIEYTDVEGKIYRVQVSNAAKEAGKIDLRFTEPEQVIEAGPGEVAPPAGPVAFQGGLASAQQDRFGVTKEMADQGVTSRKTRKGQNFDTTQTIKDAVKDNATKLPIAGVSVAVDNDLIQAAKNAGVTEEKLLKALSDAVNAELAVNKELLTNLTKVRGEGYVLTLALLNRSFNPAENHIGDGLIGINEAFFEALIEPATRGLFLVALSSAFVHELRHESTPNAQQSGDNELPFEATQVPKDVALFFTLAAQQGVEVNLALLQSLSTLMNRNSPFVAVLASVAAALRYSPQVAQEQDLVDYLALINQDASKPENAETLAALGALTEATEALVLPTLIVDVDAFDPVKLTEMLENLKAKLKPDEIIEIVLTSLQEEPVNLEGDFREKASKLGISVDRLTLKTVLRGKKMPGENYAKEIYKLVATRPNLRIFTNDANYEAVYKYIEVAMAFVQTLFRDTQEITLTFSKAEYERIIKALREIGATEVLKILENPANVESIGNLRKLKLPATFIANSEAMNALIRARNLIAKQA